jgi:hypothetical protein
LASRFGPEEQAALYLSGSVNGPLAVRMLVDDIGNKVPLPPITTKQLQPTW